MQNLNLKTYRLLGRPLCKREDNIKTDLKEMEDFISTHVVGDSVRLL
jgi:hypothetical protein